VNETDRELGRLAGRLEAVEKETDEQWLAIERLKKLASPPPKKERPRDSNSPDLLRYLPSTKVMIGVLAVIGLAAGWWTQDQLISWGRLAYQFLLIPATLTDGVTP
jgi:hypothetical protein